MDSGTGNARNFLDQAPPRIERLKVKNFQMLKDVNLENLTPLTVLLGPNGSTVSRQSSMFSHF